MKISFLQFLYLSFLLIPWWGYLLLALASLVAQRIAIELADFFDSATIAIVGGIGALYWMWFFVFLAAVSGIVHLFQFFKNT